MFLLLNKLLPSPQPPSKTYTMKKLMIGQTLNKFLDLFGQMIKNSPTAGDGAAVYENPEFHMESGMVQVTESDAVVWFISS